VRSFEPQLWQPGNEAVLCDAFLACHPRSQHRWDATPTQYYQHILIGFGPSNSRGEIVGALWLCLRFVPFSACERPQSALRLGRTVAA